MPHGCMEIVNEKWMELYAEKEMDLEKEREGNRWRKRKREGENMKDIQTYIYCNTVMDYDRLKEGDRN